ncbi:MAG TPA: ATP-binding cassette domain-containing protein [Desulfomonilia bacterium]
MPESFLSFNDVSFTYDALADMLISGMSASFPNGWTGIVGANGVGKSTILKLASNELTPLKGKIISPGTAVYCAQRTDKAPPDLPDLIMSADSASCNLRRILEIGDDWPERWETLSHGERKRAQIAEALWRKPGVLALDEPTNHIDMATRAMLISSLSGFGGIGLIVSHDRELLDKLCSRCLFVDTPKCTMRPGNYSLASAQEKKETEAALRKKVAAKEAYAKLKREASSRMNEARAADRKRSKRGIDKKDHDAKSKINLARVTGKDAVAGKLLRQLEGRLDQAKKLEQSVKVNKTYDLGIWIEGLRCERDFLFRINSGEIPLGAGRKLFFPDLAMRPDDRIAVSGINGAGKSTLIRHVISCSCLPEDKITYIPQEIDLKDTGRIMDEVKRLPRERLGHVMTVVSCLGSRPGRLLESTEPSPGETRKILLSLGISRNPWLIIMDEPTNHMDLPSITCLEEALAGCPCGLLLISHDRRFLDSLTEKDWRIIKNASGDSRLFID